MVLIEAIGIASKEIFDYNRENFKFDQEQRLQKDLARVEMQIKRFELFREDIEDLVKLTVDKMDMYHLIGALFLGFTTTIYCEGRVEDPPNWFNGLYLLSVASSLAYLLLAVWLSMHASISSHSFGVRLRTRYVRLPIPSLSQIASLTAKLSDFENQGVKKMMRVPFAPNAQNWQLNQGKDSAPRSANGGQAPPSAASSSRGDHLGPGDDGFAAEDVVMTAAQGLPGKHVALFRKLQAKWQCYDAYARVSMALGVHQMLNSLNYYMVGANLIKWKSPTMAYACTIVFQCATLGIGLLDIAGWSKLQIAMLIFTGSLPIIIILVLLTLGNLGRDRDMEFDFHRDLPSWAGHVQYIAPAAYLIQGVWFWLLLWVAKPSKDEASLPRAFRAVLFLDVFGGASYDPTEAEHTKARTEQSAQAAAKDELHEHLAASAEHALADAQAALRRWEAVPQELLTAVQRETVGVQRKEYTFWRRTFHGHLVQQQAKRGIAYDVKALDLQDLRPWEALSRIEKQEDLFAEALLGPLEQASSSGGLVKYHYDLENGEQIWEELMDQRVLSLQEVCDLVRKCKDRVRALLNKEDRTPVHRDDDDDSDSDSSDETCCSKKEVCSVESKDRLPWKIIRRLTKTLALCWFALGVELIVEDACGMHTGSSERKEHAKHSEHSERRLAARRRSAVAWEELEQVEVKWPYGSFFQPASVSCFSGNLTIGSQYKLYRAALGLEPLRLAPLPRSQPGAVALCPHPEPDSCLLGALVPGGITVWEQSAHVEVVLPLPSLWRTFTGAVVRCSDSAALLPPGACTAAAWHLLLVGWDGERVVVGAAPLASGPTALPTGAFAPRFDVPAAGAAAKGDSRAVALHLEPGAGRLWLLLASGKLQAWELYAFRSGGQKHLRWPRHLGKFQPAAFCAGSAGELMVVGHGDVAGPALLRLRGREGEVLGRGVLPRSGSSVRVRSDGL